jgi:hypothetical protein
MHHFVPVGQNIIHVSGIGPILLHNSEYHPALPPLPAWFWILVTMLSCTGAVLLLLDLALVMRSIISGLRGRRINLITCVRIFLVLATCIYLTPIILAGYFDRYLLPPTFMMLTLLATCEVRSHTSTTRWLSHERLIQIASIFIAMLTSAFAVAGTHDYLSWNRTRWALLDTLEKHGVPARSIDGGFEFNGINLYDPAYVEAPPKSHWWVYDDEYIVQFTLIAGYHAVASAQAGSWLPALKTNLQTLARDGN